MVGASNIALDQIESITCVYSSVVSLYLVIRSLVIKCCLYLHPIRLSKQIAAHIFKWRIVWERLRGTEVEYESVESVVNQLNTDIVGWINPLEIFLFTVIHGILYMTINALLETNWCLNAICVGIVGFLVIPMSIGITLTSIITQKNVFDPEQILKYQ